MVIEIGDMEDLRMMVDFGYIWVFVMVWRKLSNIFIRGYMFYVSEICELSIRRNKYFFKDFCYYYWFCFI